MNDQTKTRTMTRGLAQIIYNNATADLGTDLGGFSCIDLLQDNFDCDYKEAQQMAYDLTRHHDLVAVEAHVREATQLGYKITGLAFRSNKLSRDAADWDCMHPAECDRLEAEIKTLNTLQRAALQRANNIANDRLHAFIDRENAKTGSLEKPQNGYAHGYKLGFGYIGNMGTGFDDRQYYLDLRAWDKHQGWRAVYGRCHPRHVYRWLDEIDKVKAWADKVGARKAEFYLGGQAVRYVTGQLQSEKEMI